MDLLAIPRKSLDPSVKRAIFLHSSRFSSKVSIDGVGASMSVVRLAFSSGIRAMHLKTHRISAKGTKFRYISILL